MDHIVIVQEMLHSMRRKKGKVGSIALKTELKTAYNKMN